MKTNKTIDALLFAYTLGHMDASEGTSLSDGRVLFLKTLVPNKEVICPNCGDPIKGDEPGLCVNCV